MLCWKPSRKFFFRAKTSPYFPASHQDLQLVPWWGSWSSAGSMVIFGSVIIKKTTGIDIGSTKTHDLPVEMTSWRDVCRTWLMPTNLKHLVASIGWHLHAAWSFQDVGPWFWGFRNMIFRQNLTIVESVKSLKPVGPVMDGPSVFPDTRWEKKGPWHSLQRETFVIPTPQLKTTTHIFRNLNR